MRSITWVRVLQKFGTILLAPPYSIPAPRVFLFVDPELVSASVCSALLLEIEAAQEQQTPEACMRHVVSHALQAALGEACHTGALNRKLQVVTTTAWASSALTACTLPASGPCHPSPDKSYMFIKGNMKMQISC